MDTKLDTYRAKRDFGRTPEPRPAAPRGVSQRLRFVVQKHEASHLHYDFRLELDGRLLSWAVPKGPSLDPKNKRLAVQVEDHPVAYASFEGTIAQGQYGAGTVTVWDHGHWLPDGGARQARQDYADGKLAFRLDGEKLRGHWTLVRTRLRGSSDKAQWLLIKQDDEFAGPDVDVTAAQSEVAFAERTGDGIVRQASFQGLRQDKPAADIGPEQAIAVKTVTAVPKVRGLRISSPARVIDPASGATKLDLVRYYDAMAERLLPHLKGRPVAVLRAPEGVQGELVFQKHVKPTLIPKAQQLDPALDPGHAPLIAIGNATALVGAAQFNVVEMHTWNALATSIERPDRLVFDLDPGSGLPWAQLLEAAGRVRTLLDELGLSSFVKTSGSKGLHIVVPIARRHGWDETLAFAKAVSRHLAATLPQRFTATPGARHRVGKVFVDYLRNARGATSVCAWSVRARPTLPVSVPVAWDELAKLRSSSQWTIRDMEQRLQRLGDADPWQGYAAAARQSLARALRRWPPQDQT
jgi:DNA ligase D-like protein (predicted polymerase)/DNA ligase D-like protein (predicted 3'-phosphoesterase)